MADRSRRAYRIVLSVLAWVLSVFAASFAYSFLGSTSWSSGIRYLAGLVLMLAPLTVFFLAVELLRRERRTGTRGTDRGTSSVPGPPEGRKTGGGRPDPGGLRLSVAGGPALAVGPASVLVAGSVSLRTQPELADRRRVETTAPPDGKKFCGR